MMANWRRGPDLLGATVTQLKPIRNHVGTQAWYCQNVWSFKESQKLQNLRDSSSFLSVSSQLIFFNTVCTKRNMSVD